MYYTIGVQSRGTRAESTRCAVVRRARRLFLSCSTETTRLFSDGRGWTGRGRLITYRYTVTTRMPLALVKMGSDENHFKVSLIVRDTVTRQCPQTTTFFKRRREPKRNRAEALLLTSLTHYRWAKPAHELEPRGVVLFWSGLRGGLVKSVQANEHLRGGWYVQFPGSYVCCRCRCRSRNVCLAQYTRTRESLHGKHGFDFKVILF